MAAEMKGIKFLCFAIIPLLLMLPASPAMAGDIPASDVEYIRLLLLQPDVDFTLFRGDELCDTLMYIIDNDRTSQRDMVVRRALCALPETADVRAVDYLTEYIPEHPLDCLDGLGYFSTVESCDTLLYYIDDEDRFVRRFAAQSLGMLDFTVSDEMWAKHDLVLSSLSRRMQLETEEWILPIIELSFTTSSAQVFEAHT